MSSKIMLVGEPMGLFIAQEEGPLEEVRHYSAAVAGSEFNVAVGLSRLGHEVGYMTRLGNDPFGRMIVRTMRQIGIDTSLIDFHPERRTGFMLKGKTGSGDPDIFYFRKNSAASTITADDIDKIDFRDYRILHLTGIFPALSEATLEAARHMIRKARENGLLISFDPNLRPQLWPDVPTMVKTLNELAFRADYVLPGYKEGKVLAGTEDPEKIAEYYLSHGAKTVLVKLGKKGAYAATRDGGFFSGTYPDKTVVDTVGAGDGFAVGVLSAVAEGLGLEDALRRGNAIGTIQVMSEGDNDGLPTRRELGCFMAENRQKSV